MVAHGAAAADKDYDGSDLRIGIVHARWNAKIIDALLTGAKKALTDAGVKKQNIVVQSVPGSYELPFAVQRMYASSQLQATASGAGGALLSSATDLLSSTSVTDLTKAKDDVTAKAKDIVSTQTFDAIIAIGVLIKGETMHFEYISDAVSHGLMRVQLDTQLPVIFGVLTALDESQALIRAGIGGSGGSEGVNHGTSWGSAAVELGVKRRGWSKGEMVE